jgi:hypothetical protein
MTFSEKLRLFQELRGFLNTFLVDFSSFFRYVSVAFIKPIAGPPLYLPYQCFLLKMALRPKKVKDSAIPFILRLLQFASIKIL